MRTFFLILFIILIAGVFIIFIPRVFSSTPQNVFFLDQNFDSVKRNDIIPYLQLLQEKWLSSPIEIVALNKKFLIDKKALFLQWDLPRIKKSLLQKKDQQVPAYFVWDEKKAKEAFQFIAEKTYIPPLDAFMEEGRISHSLPGYRLDVLKAIEETRNSLSHGSDQMTLGSYQVLPPAIDTKKLLTSLGFDYLLAQFETSLVEKDEKTRFNIEKGAKTMSGYVLEKGAPFSFNQVVGPADKDDGYLETKIVVNGNLVPGYGGGVCQISSTLYNALLKCDAKILERSPHSGYSETTSYVLPGFDAAVSYGFKDLKFNFPDQRTVIFTYIDKDRLVAEIWGEKENTASKVIASRIQNITENGDQNAVLKVETTVIKDDKIEKKYTDTYSVPFDYARVLKKQADKN